MTNPRGHFVLKIPANPKYVGVARLAVSGLASRLKLSYEDVEDIKLAVAEACARAMSHGQDQEISIECEVKEDHLSLSVSERTQVPEDEDDLGMILIRSLMDDVRFESHNGRGNRLVMKKRFGKNES